VAAIRGARSQADYLIERARAAFPGASPEQKVKAMNYLLPHIRRMPEKLARDQFAGDAAQKLGIDSAVLREELRQAALKRRDRIEGHGQVGLLPFERFFVEATCNDVKGSSEYQELHETLRTFDCEMKEKFKSADWQASVLSNLPEGLFDRLVSRQQGQDIEGTASTEEQRIFLRKLFLETSTHPRMHRQDSAIIKDLKMQAVKWEVMKKRAAVDLVKREGDFEGSIRISQNILELERYLRTIQDEE
jgi:DNA primase